MGVQRLLVSLGEKSMMGEDQIRALLEDIRSAYLVGYSSNDLDTEAEKWGQIQILEHVLAEDKNSRESPTV